MFVLADTLCILPVQRHARSHLNEASIKTAQASQFGVLPVSSVWRIKVLFNGNVDRTNSLSHYVTLLNPNQFVTRRVFNEPFLWTKRDWLIGAMKSLSQAKMLASKFGKW